MKKYISHYAFNLAIACMFLVSYSAQAECIYQKTLKAEEYPIGIRLTWSTSFEQNTSVFVLEKATTSDDFQMVATIEAAKNSSKVVPYKFLDVRPSTTKISYRIKQVDMDGTFSYSDVFVINCKLENNIMIAELPKGVIDNNYKFTLDALKEGNLNLRLVDFAGKTVWQSTREVTNGLNEFKIDFSAQPEGEYRIVATMGRDEKVIDVRRTFDEIERAPNVAEHKKVSKN